MSEQPKNTGGVGGWRILRLVWVRMVGWGSTISDFLHYTTTRFRSGWGAWWQEAGRRLIVRGLTRLAALVILGVMASAVVNYTYRAYSLRQHWWDPPVEHGAQLGVEVAPEVSIPQDVSGLASEQDAELSGRLALGPGAEELFSTNSRDMESGVEVVATSTERFQNLTPGISPEPRKSVNPANMTWPVQGQVLVGYGWVRHPVYRDWRFHPGVELSTPMHASVQAVMDGRIQQIQSERAQGLVVTIDHGDDWQTVYRGLAQLQVREGQLVKQGQTIGLVGSNEQGQNGRLLFEIRQADTPLEPRMYLP